MDVAGIYRSGSKITTQPEDRTKTSFSSFWQENSLCCKNACSCPKEAATKIGERFKIARWSGEHDDCGDKVYQHKAS
jgi:hypothetical protein